MNWWESIAIKSKQIGEQRDGFRRKTRTFTELLHMDNAQDWSPGFSLWHQRMGNFTTWRNFSTAPQIQMSSHTVWSLNSNSQSTARAVRRIIATRREETQLSNIHIRAGQIIEPQWIRVGQACEMYFWTLGLARALSNLEVSRKMHMLLGHWNIKHSSAPNIHTPTSLITLLVKVMENRSNTSAPSIISNRKPRLLFSVSGSAEDNGRMEACITVIVYDGIDGNIRGISTALDFFMAMGCHREPESSHVMSIFVQNSKTRFIPHCPPSPNTRSTWSIVMNTRTCRLWC